MSKKNPEPSNPESFTTSGKKLGYSLSDFDLLKTLGTFDDLPANYSGTGTFGRVFLSKFKGQDQYYAMKSLRKVEIIRLKQVEHMNNERIILSQVKFPFVVNLLCTFQDERNIFMLLEYVVGGELFSHLRKAGRFGNEMTRFYAAEITLAIEFLHGKNIIYRDLKPENLLLDYKGHIKITDFGFAKKVSDLTWTLCGTPEYLAPEIIQSKGHGKPVDWWALGVLIFEMLAGYPPFYDENPFGIYEKILAGKINFPSHIEENAKDLIKKLLTIDRSKRVGNLKAGADDIKKHKWNKGVSWEAIFERKIKAPMLPVCSHPGDTRNFEDYPDATPEDLANSVNLEPYQKFFKRQSGVFSRPFVYGSTAIPFTKKDIPADPSHTHKWSIYVRGVNGEDLSFLFKRVVIKIHESFPNPTRTFDKPPYQVDESGWGEFAVQIKITLHDPAEKPINLTHYLQLYCKEDIGNLTNTPKKIMTLEFLDEVVITDPIDSVYNQLIANPVELPKHPVDTKFCQMMEEKEIKVALEHLSRINLENENIASKCSQELEKLRKLQLDMDI